MIKRFLLPDWPAEMQQLVDAVSGRAFQALQDLDEWIWPAICIPQWAEQQVNMIWHHHDSMEENPFSMLAQAVSQNQIASRRGQGR